MNIECDVCKTVFKIKYAIITPGNKIKYTCKKCKPLNKIAIGERQASGHGNPPARAQELQSKVPTADHGDSRAIFLKKRVLAGIKGIPPMPQVVMEIHDQLSGKTNNTKKISDSIQTDQAIASKVLRLANSAYYKAPLRLWG
jgi:predicted Zn finger-like uncharacterized protein